MVPASKEKELWKSYQYYTEIFYDLIKINNEFRDYDFKKNLELKTAICETVEKLIDEPDVVSAFHQLQNFHQQWREIGPVAKDLREDLWSPVKMDDKQAEWESRSVTSHEVNRRWTEGSYIFKKGDTFYMMYSANYFGGANYAVGYATSKSPLGPFQKAENNPVIEKNIDKGGDVTGTGHNMVLTLNDGQMLCVYHARTQKTGNDRVVFVDKMEVDDKGILKVNGPNTEKQEISLTE